MIRRRLFHLASRGESFQHDAVLMGMPRQHIEDIFSYQKTIEWLTTFIARRIGGRAYIAMDVMEQDIETAESISQLAAKFEEKWARDKDDLEKPDPT